MTEKEAIEKLRLENGLEIKGKPVRVAEFLDGLDAAISALEEIQQYRVFGTVRQVGDFITDWRKYKELGNFEEVRELISKGKAYEQLEWERNIAISQLEEIGCSLGQKMDKVKEAMEKQRA